MLVPTKLYNKLFFFSIYFLIKIKKARNRSPYHFVACQGIQLILFPAKAKRKPKNEKKRHKCKPKFTFKALFAKIKLEYSLYAAQIFFNLVVA